MLTHRWGGRSSSWIAAAGAPSRFQPRRSPSVPTAARAFRSSGTRCMWLPREVRDEARSHLASHSLPGLHFPVVPSFAWDRTARTRCGLARAGIVAQYVGPQSLAPRWQKEHRGIILASFEGSLKSAGVTAWATGWLEWVKALVSFFRRPYWPRFEPPPGRREFASSRRRSIAQAPPLTGRKADTPRDLPGEENAPPKITWEPTRGRTPERYGNST